MERTTWSAELVIALLEEAGATLLSLPSSGCAPAGFRTAWPDFVQAAVEAYGYQDARVRPPRPTAAAISDMDRAFELVQLIPADRRVARRIVLMRALVHPRSERLDPHVWSWRRLAKVISADPRSAQAWHAGAIQQIVRRLQAPGLCAAAGGRLPPPIAAAPRRSLERV